MRRTDVEDCAINDYVYGLPCWDQEDTSNFVSPDVALIEPSALFNVVDRIPDETRALELLAGGFLQVQEYRQNNGIVNYAVNVWGPVEVPVKYVFSNKLQERNGVQLPAEEQLELRNRQFTFTWRGRRQKLSAQGESIADNKSFRWKSWFDGKGKTALLKFSFSTKSNSITVESWALNDPDPKPGQQWSQYEK